MLKVKFMQYKNVVIMEILEQAMEDYERLEQQEFKASNGFRLECETYPEIVNETKIFLKGTDEGNTTCYDFETKAKAQDFVVQASIAIKEYNSTVKTKDVPEEQIHTTIIAM
jgi:hypothetical protein